MHGEMPGRNVANKLAQNGNKAAVYIPSKTIPPPFPFATKIPIVPAHISRILICKQNALNKAAAHGTKGWLTKTSLEKCKKQVGAGNKIKKTKERKVKTVEICT